MTCQYRVRVFVPGGCTPCVTQMFAQNGKTIKGEPESGGSWLVRGCNRLNHPGSNLCSHHMQLLATRIPVQCLAVAPVQRSEPEIHGAEAAVAEYEHALPSWPTPSREAKEEGISWLLGVSYEGPEWQRTTSFSSF